METTPQKSVAALINSNFKAMKSVLPKHMTAERMARIALIEVRRNPRLAQSDPATLIGAILVASQLGLEPGIQGSGYLIPYYNSNRKCYEVQFQIGYRGMMDLARRSGGVGMITAEVVHAADDFTYRLGTDPTISHVPAMGDRGPITHFYSVAKLIPSGHVQFRVMTLAEVEKVRDLHSKAKRDKEGGFSPWRDHFEEMGLKTLIRRNCKYLPVSPELQKAVSLDEMADAGIAQNLSAELPFDLEVPADFESAEAAEKMNGTVDKIKADLAEAEQELPDQVEAPDDFDMMDRDALDNFLSRQAEQPHPAAVKKTIKSALAIDNLDIKRNLARKLVADA